jgi:APA family basic amino acid/polyamine antiporter
VSIIVLNLWAALLVLSGKYDDLFNLVIFASWILYGMTAAAVLVLRRSRPDLIRPYRTVGYPFVPVLFILGACVLLITTAIERPRESLLGIGLIVLGLPFYFYWKKQLSRKPR